MGLQRHAATAIVTLLAFACVSAATTDCPALLEEFYSFNRHQQPSSFSSDSQLFVLHTPPQLSAQLDKCLLRPGTTGLRRCPTFTGEQISKELISKIPQDCMWSSGDDLSVLQLVDGKVAVVTQLQHPEQRFVQAYELAIELAAQNLLDEATPSKGPYDSYFKKKHPMNVWPWTVLAKFLMKDVMDKFEKLEEREAATPESEKWIEVETVRGRTFYYNTATEEQKDELTQEERNLLAPTVDPYNNELIQPLKEFVNNPRVVKLLHNGALMQVLGLTNVSRWDKAQELRKCIRKDQAVADSLLEFAKKRIDSFAHVGITEDADSSTEVAASLFSLQLDKPAFIPGEKYVKGLKKIKTLSWKGGMKMNDMKSTPIELEGETHTATTIEELRAMLADKEKEAQELYDMGYKMYMDGNKHDNLKLMETRKKLSDVKSTAMQWKFDLEEWEKEANLTKTLDHSLSDEYHACVARMQRDAENRTRKALDVLNLPDGRPIRFTPEARKNIPDEVLAEIRRVNALDVVLYEHAQQLLQQRKQALAAAGKLQKLQAPPSPEVMQQQEAAAALALGLPDSIEQQQQLQQRAAGGGEGGQQPPGHSKTEEL